MPESHNEEDLVALTVLGLLGMESRARPSRAEASPRPTRAEIRRRLLPADGQGGLSEEERNDLNKRRDEEQELPSSSLIALKRDGEPLGAVDVSGASDSEEEARGNVPTPIAKSDREPPQANTGEFQITDNGELSEDQKRDFIERFGARETIAKIPGVMDILQDELMSGPITATDTQFILQYLAQEPGVPTEEITEKMSKKTGFLARMWRRIFGSRNKQLLDTLKVTSSNLTKAKEQTVKLQQQLEDKKAEIKALQEQIDKNTSTNQGEVETLTAQIKTLQQEIALQKDNNRVQADLIDETNDQLTSAQAENAKLLAQKDSLSEERAAFEKQRAALTGAAKNLQSQNKKLQSRNEELAKQLTAEKAKEKAKQAAIDSQIKDNSKQLEDLNLLLEEASKSLQVAEERAAQAEARAAAEAAAKAAADEGSQDLKEQLEAAERENTRLRVEMKKFTAQLNTSLGVNQSVEGRNSSGKNRPVTPQSGRLFMLPYSPGPAPGPAPGPDADKESKPQDSPGPDADKQSQPELTANQIAQLKKLKIKEGSSSPGKRLRAALAFSRPKRKTKPIKRLEAGGDNIEGNPPKNPANLFKPLRF